MGDGEQRPLSGREILAGCGARLGHPGALANQSEARQRRFLRRGWSPSVAGRSCSGIGAAAPGRNRGRGLAGEGRRGRRGRAGASSALPSPAVSSATATSPRRRGELEGESLPVATQRPGDVRRLSLVPKVTGRAAGPGTICVCPQRVCGASGVWRS